MLTITDAVEQLVSASDFAIEGLQSGCLNTTAYAAMINRDGEQLTKKAVQKASIVVALGRLAKRYRALVPDIADFGLLNLVSRSGLTELTYAKTDSLQMGAAKLLEAAGMRSSPFCITVVGLAEISIVADARLAGTIEAMLADERLTLRRTHLSSLTMKVDINTADMPRQSYTVIQPLALRDINVIEYVTTPSELTLILNDADLKQSFSILYDRFFGGPSTTMTASDWSAPVWTGR